VDLTYKLRARDANAGAEEATHGLKNVVIMETIQEANDGQQYQIFFLDADDSFDVVVQYPNGEREIVWSLVREREIIR